MSDSSISAEFSVIADARPEKAFDTAPDAHTKVWMSRVTRPCSECKDLRGSSPPALLRPTKVSLQRSRLDVLSTLARAQLYPRIPRSLPSSLGGPILRVGTIRRAEKSPLLANITEGRSHIQERDRIPRSSMIEFHDQTPLHFTES